MSRARQRHPNLPDQKKMNRYYKEDQQFIYRLAENEDEAREMFEMALDCDSLKIDVESYTPEETDD